MNTSKRRRICAALALMVAIALNGCANYMPATGWNYNGYSSVDIDATTVDVRFANSRGALAGTVRDLALYRCAEIAKERGFDGFMVLSSSAFQSLGGRFQLAEANIRMRMFRGSVTEMKQALQGSKADVYEASAVLRRLEVVVKR